MKNKQPMLPKKDLYSLYSLYTDGHYQKAINRIKVLNETYPNMPILFNLTGACYKELGELIRAGKMFEMAVLLNPKYSEAYFNLGVIHQELNDFNLAISNYKKAVSITPKYPEAYNNLGTSLYAIGEIQASIENLEWAIAYKHDFAEAYNNLGRSLTDYGSVEKAIKNFKLAITHKLDYANAYFNLALSMKDIGDKDGFLENIMKTLEIKPEWGAANYHLSQLKKYKKNDTRIIEMQSFLEKSELDITDRINLNFALAKACDDIESHEKQFKYLETGNSLRKNQLKYTIERDLKLFSRIKDAFKPRPSNLNKKLLKSKPFVPIFILGMPRSGTSLVHQILDSHKDIYGAGELNIINKLVYPYVNENSKVHESGFLKDDFLSIRESYLDALIALNTDKKIIVDKMPLNFRYVGFILMAFPEAKIIHMQRDPMATCWSIFKSFFNGNAYSFNQEDLADYYNLYKDLMIFWNKFFPGQIHNLCYEDLTNNQILETRNLLEYCGIDWDENCLNFHKSNTAVKTTSSMQVRQKMYKGSSEIWKKYEAYLQPLIKGLDYK